MFMAWCDYDRLVTGGEVSQCLQQGVTMIG